MTYDHMLERGWTLQTHDMCMSTAHLICWVICSNWQTTLTGWGRQLEKFCMYKTRGEESCTSVLSVAHPVGRANGCVRDEGGREGWPACCLHVTTTKRRTSPKTNCDILLMYAEYLMLNVIPLIGKILLIKYFRGRDQLQKFNMQKIKLQGDDQW